MWPLCKYFVGLWSESEMNLLFVRIVRLTSGYTQARWFQRFRILPLYRDMIQFDKHIFQLGGSTTNNKWIKQTMINPSQAFSNKQGINSPRFKGFWLKRVPFFVAQNGDGVFCVDALSSGMPQTGWLLRWGWRHVETMRSLSQLYRYKLIVQFSGKSWK